MFIDTHCHLNSDQLYKIKDEVLKDAKSQNVELFIVPGFDLETSKLAIKLAEEYKNVYASVGFHPTEIKDYSDSHYEWLEKAAKHPKVVAIGEIGYDFHWDTTTKEEQEVSFKRQIVIAKRVGKPLIIHSRDAMKITFDTLIETDAFNLGGVMHSYSGSVEMAKEFVKRGYYLGIGGPVTFSNAKDPKLVVSEIDLKHIITETDSPYLTPHPYRGKMNSPKYIPLIAKKIAELKNIDLETLQKQVLENVKSLFKIEV
jgi:TatD DNase family protein